MDTIQIIQQLLFILVAGIAIFLFARKVAGVRRNILLGRDEDRTNNPGARWKNVVLLALGQKKMFKKPVPAILHFFVYAGFVLINIEVLEILIDGVFGRHRTFAPLLGDFYGWVIGFFEILAVLTLVAVIAFLVRRNVLKVKRLNQPELNGWPRKDANTILYIEVVLMTMLLLMNTAEGAIRMMVVDVARPSPQANATTASERSPVQNICSNRTAKRFWLTAGFFKA